MKIAKVLDLRELILEEELALEKSMNLSGGAWKTVRGAKVYIKGGKVVAGAKGKLSGKKASGSKTSSGKKDSGSKTSKKEKPMQPMSQKDLEDIRDASLGIKKKKPMKPMSQKELEGIRDASLKQFKGKRVDPKELYREVKLGKDNKIKLDGDGNVKDWGKFDDFAADYFEEKGYDINFKETEFEKKGDKLHFSGKDRKGNKYNLTFNLKTNSVSGHNITSSDDD